MKRCRKHGGASPQAKHAAKRRDVEARARRRLGGREIEPVDDPVQALLDVVAEARTFKDLLAEKLDDPAHSDAYGRALERVGKLLVDVNRLDLEDRLVRLQEMQVRRVVTAVRGVLLDAGLEPDEEAVRKSLRHHFTAVESGRRPDRNRPMPVPAGAPGGAILVEDVLHRMNPDGDAEDVTFVTLREVRDVLARALRERRAG